VGLSRSACPPTPAWPVMSLPIRIIAAAVALSFPLLATSGCDSGPTEPGEEQVTFDLDFTPGPDQLPPEAQGWEAGFANYSPAQEEIMEFASGHEPLPADVVGGPGEDAHGLFIGATNRSDDVFMFWTGQVEGLEPDATYRVQFEVEFATDSPAGCAGIGGPPGESVWVKAGAVPDRPEPFLDPDESQHGYWFINIDKGNQSQDGPDARILGDVANTESGCGDEERVWEMKTLEGDGTFEARSDDEGRIWLLVGTDSGFEGRTELYYTRYRATFDPV